MEESLFKYQMCDKKTAYTSRKDAIEFMRKAKRKGILIPIKDMHIYRCPFCHKYHWGHKNGR